MIKLFTLNEKWNKRLTVSSQKSYVETLTPNVMTLSPTLTLNPLHEDTAIYKPGRVLFPASLLGTGRRYISVV